MSTIRNERDFNSIELTYRTYYEKKGLNNSADSIEIAKQIINNSNSKFNDVKDSIEIVKNFNNDSAQSITEPKLPEREKKIVTQLQQKMNELDFGLKTIQLLNQVLDVTTKKELFDKSNRLIENWVAMQQAYDSKNLQEAKKLANEIYQEVTLPSDVKEMNSDQKFLLEILNSKS